MLDVDAFTGLILKVTLLPGVGFGRRPTLDHLQVIIFSKNTLNLYQYTYLLRNIRNSVILSKSSGYSVFFCFARNKS